MRMYTLNVSSIHIKTDQSQILALKGYNGSENRQYRYKLYFTYCHSTIGHTQEELSHQETSINFGTLKGV